MKKSNIKKYWKFLIIPITGAILGSVIASSVACINSSTNTTAKNNVNNQSASESTSNEALAKQAEVAKILNNASSSKELTCDLNIQPSGTAVNKISYLNGTNQTVFSVWIESDGSIYAESLKPISIEVNANENNPTNIADVINGENFNISLTSYSSNPYNIIGGNDGYSLSQPTTVNFPWTVKNQTFLTPNKIITSNSEVNSGQSFVVFPTFSKQKIGSVSNGFVKMHLHFKLPSTVDGNYGNPNTIDVASNQIYTPTLKASGDVLDNTLIFTPFNGGKILYLPSADPMYSYVTGNIVSSTNQLASDFLSQMTSIGATINNVVFDNGNANDVNNKRLITPKIYGYANDSEGTLSIVFYEPYIVKRSQENQTKLEVAFNPPKIYTVANFKKSIGNVNQSQTITIHSSDIDFQNVSSPKKTKLTQNTGDKLNFGFQLSPLSLFDFSLENNGINIKPTTLSNNNSLYLNNIFNDYEKIDWDLINKAFNINNNAVSKYANTYNYNDFKYSTLNPATLYTTYLSNDQFVSSTSNPFINLFSMEDIKGNNGPWVVDPSKVPNHPSGYSSQYVNYLKYLEVLNQNSFASLLPKFQQVISYNGYFQLKHLFGSALPNVKDPLVGQGFIDQYFNLLNDYKILINNSAGTKERISKKVNPSDIGLSNLLFYENGPVILKSDSPLSYDVHPYLFDNTSLIAWTDIKGINHFSLENNNIFSTKENLKFNLDHIDNPEIFGNTYFDCDVNQANLNKNILPSKFVSNKSNYSNLQITAYNCVSANNDNTKIELIPNDQEGSVVVRITPYLQTTLNENVIVNNVQTLNNFSSYEVGQLLDSKLSKPLTHTYEYKIQGFLTSGIQNEPNKEGWTNESSTYPSEAFVVSSILGTDYEANLDRFKKESNEKFESFQAFFIADALNKLVNEKVLTIFNPIDKNNIGLIAQDGSVNLKAFNEIISKYTLISSDMYNQYVYNVSFKPGTLKDVYGYYNQNETSIKLTIATTGTTYQSWVANDYISTGLSLYYKKSGTPSPIPSKVSKADFINNFGNSLIEKNNQNSLIRYYQNGYYENEVSLNTNPLKSSVSVTYNQNSANQYDITAQRTIPIIYGLENNYGFKYNELGLKQGRDFNSTIQDIGNWSFSFSKVSNINNGSIALQYQPKVWMQDNKFITSNIEQKTIRFGDIVETNGKTTALNQNKISSLDTSLSAKNIYDQIINKNGNYQTILNQINEIIDYRLPDSVNPSKNTSIEITILDKYILKSDQSNLNEVKEAWSDSLINGYFDININIWGDYYSEGNLVNKQESEKISLGIVSIINLSKSKSTRFVSGYTIPDISQYNLISNLSQYIWVKAQSLSSWNSIETIYNDVANPANINNVREFAKLIQSGVVLDGVENKTNLTFNLDDVHISNINNNNGSITFNPSSVRITGSYYDEFGQEQIASSNGIDNKQEIIINGFEKIVEEKTSVVAPANNEITIDSLAGTDVTLINENEIRNALLSNSIVKNFPYLKYGCFGLIDQTNILDENNLLDITITNKDASNGKITFTYTIKSFVTDTFVNKNGNQKIVIVNDPKFSIKDSEYTQQESLTGTLTLVNLMKTVGKETTVDTTGFEISNCSGYLLSNVLTSAGIQLNTPYNSTNNNAFVDFVISEILQNNIIKNVPEKFNNSNVEITILSINNNKGLLSLEIKLNKFYEIDPTDNSLKLIDNPGFNNNCLTRSFSIVGFKKISGETTVKSNKLVVSKNIVNTGNLSNVSQWQTIVFDYLSAFFDNTPSLSISTGSVIDENNPIITKSDIDITNLVVAADNSSVSFDISLKSFFENDPSYNTVVWKHATPTTAISKSFGNFVITGFNDNANTSLASSIFLTPNDTQLISQFASTVSKELKNYSTTLANLIVNRGISGSTPSSFAANNIRIESSSFDNLNGTLSLSIKITNYLENGVVKNDWKGPSNITVYGFRKSSPTLVKTQYNGFLDNNINSKFAYEFNEYDIKSLLFNSLIINVPDDFSIGNIEISSIRYNNSIGSLTFTPIINNYFDVTGDIRSGGEGKYFQDVTIVGFKSVSNSTTINSSCYVTGADRKELAISFLDYASVENIKPTTKLKTFILDNMINNAPHGLTIDDFNVSSISVNNSSGMISCTVELMKYINSNFELVDAVNSPSKPKLTQNINIFGFLNVGQTTISSELNINNMQYGAYDYATNHRTDLEKFVFDNIQNKWSVKSNTFNQTDFSIYNITPNNINGSIKLQVGFKKYIDGLGQYHVINPGEYPYLVDVTISGFKPINSSIIIEKFKIPSNEEIFASDYIKNASAFDQDIRTIILNNLLVNKLPSTSINDIKIINKEANNKLGIILVDVEWTNNFIDQNGKQITNSTDKISQRIIFSGFKQVSSGTNVKNIVSIASLDYNGKKLSQITPQEFGKVENNVTTNEDLIKNIIIENLSNAPKKLNNATGKYEVDVQVSDIKISKQIMSDNAPYFGYVNNFEGYLYVPFTISKYIDNNGDYVDCNLDPNKSPLSLKIQLVDFKRIADKPTSVQNELDLKTLDLSKFTDTQLKDYLNMTADEFLQLKLDSDATQLKYFIVKSGIIENWPLLLEIFKQKGFMDSNGNYLNGYDYKTSLEKLTINDVNQFTSKLQIVKSVTVNNSVLCKLRLMDFTSDVDGILSHGKWSNYYTFTISGFVPVNQTSFNDDVKLTGTINQDLSSYEIGHAFKDINVFNLTDNDVNIIVQSKLDEIINNQTIYIKNIAKATIFSISGFENYIKLSNISRDGNAGCITFDISISSFINANNEEITELITSSNPNLKVMTSRVSLYGFIKTPKTIIEQRVKLTTENAIKYSPNRIYEVPGLLKQMILNQQDEATKNNKVDELIFKNLPEQINLDQSLTVSIIDFDNINGIVRAKLSLTSYFSENGQFVNNNGGILSATVIFSGLKKTLPTALRQEISLSSIGFGQNEYNLEDIDKLMPLIKQNMAKTQNLFAQSGSSFSDGLIWENLPNEGIIDQNNFEINYIANSINYKNGSVDLDVKMNCFYNANGIEVNDGHTSIILHTRITGFRQVLGPTQPTVTASNPSSKGVDISGLSISRYTVRDIINGTALLRSSDFDNNILKQMFDYLPSTFTTSNIVSLEPINTPGSYDTKEGTITIGIKLNNYFKQDSINIINAHDESPLFKIKLCGFQKIDVTTVKSEFAISSIYSNTIETIDAATIQNYLNIPEIKEQVLVNYVKDIQTGNINTGIWVNDLSPNRIEVDGPRGEINLTIQLTDNYVEKNGEIDINKNKNGQFKLKLTGFTPIKETQCNTSVELQADSSSIKASDFAEQEGNIKQFLFGKRNILFDEQSQNNINIVKIVNPNTKESDLGTSNLNNQIYVNDNEGVIRFKFTYTGWYNQHAYKENTEKLSGLVEITGFHKEQVTKWNIQKGATLTSEIYDVNGKQEEVYTLGLTYPELANIDVNTVSIDQVKVVEMIKSNLANNDSNSTLTFAQTDKDNNGGTVWEKNQHEGTMSTVVSVNNWMQTFDNKDVNSRFTNDSVFVKPVHKTIRVVIRGYKKINLEKTKTNMAVIIGLSAGLLGLILISIILIFAFRRKIF